MEKLVKVKHEMFNEYFEGERKGYIARRYVHHTSLQGWRSLYLWYRIIIVEF